MTRLPPILPALAVAGLLSACAAPQPVMLYIPAPQYSSPGYQPRTYPLPAPTPITPPAAAVPEYPGYKAPEYKTPEYNSPDYAPPDTLAPPPSPAAPAQATDAVPPAAPARDAPAPPTDTAPAPTAEAPPAPGRPATRATTPGNSVPLMGFRPMRGQQGL